MSPHAQQPEPTGADLVVLSHLRRAFVWQRPQHLITRLTAARAGDGGRIWFVEEPWAKPDVDSPRLRVEAHGDVTRVWLPVVSTPVPDVIADFGGVVHIAAEPGEFVSACVAALAEPLENRDGKLRRIERRYQWDDIAGRIHAILQDVLSASAPASPAWSSTGVTA